MRARGLGSNDFKIKFFIYYDDLSMSTHGHLLVELGFFLSNDLRFRELVGVNKSNIANISFP